MGTKTTRDNIVEAADRLFYEKGFDKTSFADIAKAVNISRGNFYYHFKCKDDILDAVISLRIHHTKEMLKSWEENEKNPMDRILCFVRILRTNHEGIKKFGCPVGSLCTELSKVNHSSQEDSNKILSLFRHWLKKQFTLLGRKKDADALALHLLAQSQGVATLAQAFCEDAFIQNEVKLMEKWVTSL